MTSTSSDASDFVEVKGPSDWFDVLENTRESEVVRDLRCPITNNIMKDPVRASDGITYERSAITNWFSKNGYVSAYVRDGEGKPKEIGNKLEPDLKRRAAVDILYQSVLEMESVAGSEADEQSAVGGARDTEHDIFLAQAEAHVKAVQWEGWGEQDGPRSVELRVPSKQIVDPPRSVNLEHVSNLPASLSRMFKVIDSIPLDLSCLIGGLQPPKIIVVGNESSGKSTVLEQLVKMPLFPRAGRFCTRMAIHVHLRRPTSDDEPPSVKLYVRDCPMVKASAKEGSVARKRKKKRLKNKKDRADAQWDELPTGGGGHAEADQKDAVEEDEGELIPIASGFRFVQDKMNELQCAVALEVEAAREAGDKGAQPATHEFAASGVVVDKIIHLHVLHPEVPVLDLVDLPGMVLTEDPEHPKKSEAIEYIWDQQVARDQAEGCTSIYLAVVPAPSTTNRPNANPSLKYIQKKKLEDRTIGVFTKADLGAEDSAAHQLRAYLTGESLELEELDDDGSVMLAPDLGAVALPHGWVTTMLKMPVDSANKRYYITHGIERIKKMENDEKVFFGGESANPVLRNLYDRGLAGVGALNALLQAKYYEHVRRTWLTGEVRRMCEHILRLNYERALLGTADDARAVEQTQELLGRVGQQCHEAFIHHVVMAELGPKLNDMLIKMVGSGGEMQNDRIPHERRKILAVSLDAFLVSKASELKDLAGAIVDTLTTGEHFVAETHRQLSARVQLAPPPEGLYVPSKTTDTTWETPDGTLVRALFGTKAPAAPADDVDGGSTSSEDNDDEADELRLPVPPNPNGRRMREADECAQTCRPPAAATMPMEEKDKELHMKVIANRPMQFANFPAYVHAVAERVQALCKEKAALIKRVLFKLIDDLVAPGSPYIQMTPLSDCTYVGFSWADGHNLWDSPAITPSIKAGTPKRFIDVINTAIIRYLPKPFELKALASNEVLTNYPEASEVVEQRAHIDECIDRVQSAMLHLIGILDVDPSEPLLPTLEKLQREHGLLG